MLNNSELLEWYVLISNSLIFFCVEFKFLSDFVSCTGELVSSEIKRLEFTTI